MRKYEQKRDKWMKKGFLKGSESTPETRKLNKGTRFTLNLLPTDISEKEC